MVLNSLPSPSLGGVALIATMTGLPAMSPTDNLAVPGPTEMATLESIQASQQDHVKNLRKALDEMHRRTNRVSREHTRSKLRVKWCGPAQVTGTVSNWIFEIENLITGQRRKAHSSRRKYYADSSLNGFNNSEAKRHESEVRWRGLSNQEDSWEPADMLLQDVPVAVRAFVKNNRKQSKVRDLGRVLRIT
ncbi:Chromo (CHRromatin Organization MOdifier) domain [Phytophthora infestans]|uniref:Chromo (CHRromatin Organization MOdifier) domain n=1 Tax=Phytophthora infestans TaxID=4787 RepID=A0A8S9TSQ6_PHYIN|nr:Chromo (CHRromatin Organization MOdifier) domain [Phytophthora infestans]